MTKSREKREHATDEKLRENFSWEGKCWESKIRFSPTRCENFAFVISWRRELQTIASCIEEQSPRWVIDSYDEMSEYEAIIDWLESR